MKKPDFIEIMIFVMFFVSAIMIFLLTKAWPADICFAPETAKGMIVELEQCRIHIDELSLCTEAVRKSEQVVEAQDAAIAVYKSAIEDARKMAEAYRALFEEQKKMYEAVLKESRPSFFEQAIKAFGFIGGGILIGVLL